MKSKLKVWNEDLDHSRLLAEVMKERVASACQDLDNMDAMGPNDRPNCDEKTMLALQCLAETDFWADLDAYRCAKSSAKVIAEELDSLKQEQSAIAKRTTLFGKHFLDFRLAHDINDDDDGPENPWYMPDILMATELLEKKRNLERDLQTCFGLEQAQTVAISGEQALVGAGILRQREASDEDEINPDGATEGASISQDDKATPSHNHLLDQLRTDPMYAAKERNTTADAFDSDRYRILTQEELNGHGEPNEGFCRSDRLAEMEMRTNQLRSLEQGDLVTGLCGGAMIKRPFENAENDQHVSNLTPDKICVDEDSRSVRDCNSRGAALEKRVTSFAFGEDAGAPEDRSEIRSTR